jgi:tetratricopeptide (TPR) repeat protein
MPGSGNGIGRAFTAAELNIGPWTWKNIGVRRATATEMAIASGGDVFEGSMGIEALRQMDWIIDRKNGRAHARSRTDAASTNNSPQPGQQSVAATNQSNLRLDFWERQYFDLATDAFNSGNFDNALTNLARFLDIEPDNESALEFRGAIHYVTQDWDGAIRDFRRVGDLNPEMANYAQFYVWTIRSHLGQKDEATRDLDAWLKRSEKTKIDPWEAKIGTFLLDHLSEKDFLKASRRDPGDQGQHRCEAWFYSGMKRRLAGDATTARRYFRKCLATQESDEEEYEFAAAELKMLK